MADIGNTVQTQLTGGIYKISDWAGLVTAHSLPGQSVINGFENVRVICVLKFTKSMNKCFDFEPGTARIRY